MPAPDSPVEVLDGDSPNDLAKALVEDSTELTESELDESDESESESDETEEESDDEEKLDESEDDEEEDKEELELAEDDDEELIAPVRRKEILKAYPDIFKKFPYLEKSLYMTQQYQDVFETPAAAKEAQEVINNYKGIETDLIENANLEGVLKAVKETNPKAFTKIADDYLQTLHRIDRDAFYAISGNVVTSVITEMAREAQANPSSKDALQHAAQVLNQFVFGTSKFQPPKKLHEVTEADKAKGDIEKEREEFVRERFETTRNDVNGKVESKVKSLISNNIDKNEMMTDYVRKNASREVYERLSTTLDEDESFKGMVQRLWDKAFDENFSQKSVDRIRAAFVTKSKTVLPGIIKKARNEALKGMGKPTAKPRSRHLRSENVEDSPRRSVKKDGERKSTLDILSE